MALVGAIGSIGERPEVAVPALLRVIDSHPSDTLRREALIALRGFRDVAGLLTKLEDIAAQEERAGFAEEIRSWVRLSGTQN